MSRHTFTTGLQAAALALTTVAAAVAIQLVGWQGAQALTQGGQCNGFRGARALGASYTDHKVSVPVCGPQPLLGGSEADVRPYPGGLRTPGYQCVEFSERYLYYEFGATMPLRTDGDQVVDHYAARYRSLFTVVANGTARHAPVEGDVISFSSVRAFDGGNGGHTAVVQSSSVNSSGTGTVTIIDENGGRYASTGSEVISISRWVLRFSPYPYIKWLHPKSLPGAHAPAKTTPPKSTTPPTTHPSQPSAYHTGREVSIDRHATGGVSGHQGPSNSYATGPTRPKNSTLWIVCYVSGESIKGPYGTTTIWDLSDDGYYYTDAWIYTGSNSAVVPRCAPKRVNVDRHATGGVSGHRGPSNSYSAGPTRKVNSSLTIFCYVTGESITGPYGTTTIWDLSDDGYYYTDAWIYTGSNGAVVPRC